MTPEELEKVIKDLLNEYGATHPNEFDHNAENVGVCCEINGETFYLTLAPL